jgi:hypothetical protein
MNSHKQAAPDHPMQPLIARRWNPYAFADWAVSNNELRPFLETIRAFA